MSGFLHSRVVLRVEESSSSALPFASETDALSSLRSKGRDTSTSQRGTWRSQSGGSPDSSRSPAGVAEPPLRFTARFTRFPKLSPQRKEARGSQGGGYRRVQPVQLGWQQSSALCIKRRESYQRMPGPQKVAELTSSLRTKLDTEQRPASSLNLTSSPKAACQKCLVDTLPHFTLWEQQ